MKEYIVSVSENPKKKYKVITPEGKIIRFGDGRYQDYTIHLDKNRRRLYLARHNSRENWEDLNKAGTWARFLLWNKKTIKASIKNMEQKFKIKISLI